MTDTELLNWLEREEGAGLISDDAGHWAISFSGMQEVPNDPPQDLISNFFVEAHEWKTTIREALEYGYKTFGEG